MKSLSSNSDLTNKLIRLPVGTWICLDARSHLGADGCGRAESDLFDEPALVGIARQSLAIRIRAQ